MVLTTTLRAAFINTASGEDKYWSVKLPQITSKITTTLKHVISFTQTLDAETSAYTGLEIDSSILALNQKSYVFIEPASADYGIYVSFDSGSTDLLFIVHPDAGSGFLFFPYTGLLSNLRVRAEGSAVPYSTQDIHVVIIY